MKARFPVLLVLVVLLAGAFPALAASPGPVIPDTPEGRQISAFVAALAKPEPAALQSQGSPIRSSRRLFPGR